jgi:glycosyltransferase involved in cell wall biosynthesis
MKATACQVVTDAIRTTFNPPRVAVVMPVYNAEKHLRQAMDSILAQDYQGFEVIAVNDASTDGSRRILDEYSARDRRVRIFDLEENSGVTKALNLGLLASRSEYVARMDADDFSEPSRLGKQVAFLDKNRGVGVLGTKFLSMDESLSKTTWVNNVETSPSDVASALRRYCCIGHPTVMMRRRVVEVVGGYSEAPEHEAVEDYELWTRASRKFKLANLPDFLLKYRQHAGQVSRTLSERQKKNFEAVRKAYAEREHGNGDGR